MTVEARAVSSAEPDDPRPRRTPPPQPHVRPPALPPAREPDPSAHSIAPRKPRTIGGAVFLAVLGTTVLGLAIALAGRVQVGLSTAGAAFLGGALARLVLPQSQAGMLGIRRKLIDVSTMVLLGVGLLVVAAVIREPVG